MISAAEKMTLDRARSRYMSLPGVTGVSLGYRFAKGKRTEEIGICVHVEKKKPLTDIPDDERIDTEFEGRRTDVIENKISLFGAEQNYASTISGGISIGNESKNSSGSLGTLVYGNTDGAEYFLTNYHVAVAYVENSLRTGICQPSIPDGGRGGSQDRIGEVVDFYGDVKGDAALIRSNGNRSATTDVFNTTETLLRARDPVIGETVNKVGRTTSWTEGIVSHWGYAEVDLPNLGSTTIYAFWVVPLVDPDELIGAPGDSGSVWYLPGTGTAVGLLFGGAPSGPVMIANCRLTAAFEEFDVSLTASSGSWTTDEGYLSGLFEMPWTSTSGTVEITTGVTISKSRRNVYLFTKSDFILPGNGVMWAKRDGDAQYMPIGGQGSKPTCILGSFEAGSVVKVNLLLRPDSSIGIGNRTIPVYVGYGENIDTGGVVRITIP
jgi:hypothetical protein